MKIDDEVMILDEGLDLYAAQTNIDKYGNRILIGWMRMPSKPSNEEWIGMMTLPRKITVRKNQVYFSIPDYIDDKFNKKIGDMWECPDLFEVDNEYILIMLRNI